MLNFKATVFLIDALVIVLGALNLPTYEPPNS